MFENYLLPIVGGLLIGLSASLLLLLLGRVAGISGIFWNAITQYRDGAWRILFIIGLPLGAWLFHSVSGKPVPNETGSWLTVVVGGFLVGLGVKLGSGCTSGHGVCGIGRFSLRSLIATCTFMLFGIVTVFIVRHIL